MDANIDCGRTRAADGGDEPHGGAFANIPDTISARLLDWYGAHARVLPWRQPPGTPLPSTANWPYRVWLSEVMLQQTGVGAVIPYFAAFTARWPNVAALAAAPEAEVMAAWAGLGYYARARNLIAAARAVAAAGGRFPDDEAGLRALPGFGAYTAAAVAAIGFGARAVVVDANVERVVARLFAVTQPLPAARASIRAFTDAITPDARAGDFAQAMMDLGTAICTPRAPRCLVCPLRADCAGRATGDAQAFPVKPPKRAKPERRGRAFWITRADAFWLVRRPATGMLGGMRALPDDGWNARTDGVVTLPGEWTPLGEIRHVFTHCALTLTVLRSAGAIAPTTTPTDGGEWWPLADLAAAGLPTLYARAARLAVAS